MGVSGTNDPQVSNYGNIGFQGAHQNDGVDPNNFNGFTDQISEQGGVWVNTPYLQDISTPALTAAVLGLSDNPNGVKGETQYTPTHAFYDSFEENLQQLVDQHGLNEDQLGKLIFSHLTGVPSDDSFINQLLTEIDGQIAADLAELFELPSTGEQASNVKKRAGSHASSLDEQISELQSYANSLPEGSEKQALQDKINQMTQNLQEFKGQLNSLSENPSREQLAQLAKELGTSGENLKELTSKLSELTKNNLELQSILGKFESSIGISVNKLVGLLEELNVSYQISQGDFSSFTEGFQQMYQNALTKAFDEAFSSQLEQFSDDPELQAKLLFAHHNPDANISGDIKSLMQQLQEAAISQLNIEGWQIPGGYKPPTNSSDFASRMQNSADETFEAALENYVNPDGTVLTETQKNQVRNMYYGVTSPSGALGDVAAELEATVAAELATAFGVPNGFPVSKGSFSRSANINGQFQLKFMELLNALSPSQKAEVMKAISDPMNSSISEETKQLLNELFNQAATSVRQQFGLPDDWFPTTSALRGVTDISSAHRAAANSIMDLESEVALAITYVEQWPNSPTKAMLLNVLKIVSEAISELKEQLAIVMQKDAELATKLGEAQLDAALLKVHTNLSKLQEIKDKQAKMQALAPLFKITEVTMLLMTLAFVSIAGPLIGGPVMAAFIIDFAFKESGVFGKDKALFTFCFEKIVDKSVELLGPIIGKQAATALGLSMNCAICAGLCVSPIFGAKVILEQSGIIQTLFTDVFGCDPMVGEVIAMVVQMMIEIIVMIMLTIVTGGLSTVTAGATTSLLAASATATTAKVVGQTVQMAVRILTRIADAMLKIAKALMKIGRMGQAIGKGIQKTAEAMIKLATRLAKISSKLFKYADEVANTCKTVVEEGKKVKWTKAIKNQLKGSGKTGNLKFDKAAKQLENYIIFTKYIWDAIGGVFFTLQVSTVGAQFANSATASQIARIRGDMESMMIELEAFIKVLKKVMEKLLQGLSAMGEWMAQISQQQGSIWSDLSQSMDAIASCNQAN